MKGKQKRKRQHEIAFFSPLLIFGLVVGTFRVTPLIVGLFATWR